MSVFVDERDWTKSRGNTLDAQDAMRGIPRERNWTESRGKTLVDAQNAQRGIPRPKNLYFRQIGRKIL